MTLLSFLTHFAGFCLVSGFRSSFQLSLSNPCYVLLPTTSIFMGVCFLSLLSFLFSLPSFSFKLPYLLFFELSSSFPLFLLDYFREEKNPSVSLAELLLLTASLTVSLSRWLDFLGLSFSICQQNISTFTVLSVVWKKKKVLYERSVLLYSLPFVQLPNVDLRGAISAQSGIFTITCSSLHLDLTVGCENPDLCAM